MTLCGATVVVVKGEINPAKPLGEHEFTIEQCAHELNHVGDCLFVVPMERGN